MKTKSLQRFAFPLIIVLVSIAGCHSGRRNSISVADSANQKEIAKRDSANKVQASRADSSILANKKLSEDESKFLVKSYEDGMYELGLAQLAAKNGLDADVKDLAAELVTAHSTINLKIRQIAATANFVLPAAIDADHQNDMQDLRKLRGADFDEKYINLIVDDYEDAVDDYKDAYKNLADGVVRTFAAETLPRFQDHLEMAKKVQDRIK
jgi:putative membrane protein